MASRFVELLRGFGKTLLGTTKQITMSEPKKWVPPAKVEDVFDKALGNQFASINAPTAGAREEKELEEGDAPYQLYSLATPNGQKIGIMLEELEVQYDAHTINIMKGEQFTSGFVKVNPNSKIPALLDKSDPNNPIRLFESGSILLHLAEKHGKLLPETPHGRAETINWLMWQMGSGPYFGQFGHFFKYAPRDKIEAIEYGVARYGMEVQRCLSLLDMVLEARQYVAGDEYTIADIAIFPWVRCLDQGYGGKDFLGIENYKNVMRWANEINERPAVKRGLVVTKAS